MLRPDGRTREVAVVYARSFLIDRERAPFTKDIARAANFQSELFLDVRQKQPEALKVSLRCDFNRSFETLQTALINSAHFVTLN